MKKVDAFNSNFRHFLFEERKTSSEIYFAGYGGEVVDNSFCSSSPASALIVQNCVNKDQQLCERDGGWSEWRPWPTPDPNKLVFLNTGTSCLTQLLVLGKSCSSQICQNILITYSHWFFL